MDDPTILTIDLNFQNLPGTIGVYLLPHADGALLVESGPGSTIPNLISGLKTHGYSPNEITDVLLTHIHLDHGGASGWWASQGARIHVHSNGAPHLIDPGKLIASAARIYGDQMHILWGDFLPVPISQLNILPDESTFQIGGLQIQAFDVPGHANHHLAYLIGDACFTGDIGGIRVFDLPHISLPLVPPDLNITAWYTSIRRLIALHPGRIIPTHFGIYSDPDWHFTNLLATLDLVNAWIEQIMPQNLPLEVLRQKFIDFEIQRARLAGLDHAALQAHQTANPAYMAAEGITRYWNKFRLAPANSA